MQLANVGKAAELSKDLERVREALKDRRKGSDGGLTVKLEPRAWDMGRERSMQIPLPERTVIAVLDAEHDRLRGELVALGVTL